MIDRSNREQPSSAANHADSLFLGTRVWIATIIFNLTHRRWHCSNSYRGEYRMPSWHSYWRNPPQSIGRWMLALHLPLRCRFEANSRTWPGYGWL